MIGMKSPGQSKGPSRMSYEWKNHISSEDSDMNEMY